MVRFVSLMLPAADPISISFTTHHRSTQSPFVEGLHRLLFDFVERGRGSLDTERRRRKLTLRPTCCKYIRPPLEIVESYLQAEFCDGILRELVFAERLKHLREDRDGAQRHHFGFDGYVREMFDGADTPGDPAAVTDDGHRLVPKRERDKDAVDRILQHSWDGMVVLGCDDEIGVRFRDLLVP